MATTTNGLPYPVGTDKVVDGDDAIKALAEKVDTSLLPHGFVRLRCITAASHGSGSWNIIQLDVTSDTRGAQPWTLEAASRRLKVLKAGVYAINASMTMAGGGWCLGIGISSDGSTWDRCASTQVGSVNYSESTSTVRYLAANWYICMMAYSSGVFNTVVDAASSPAYLSVTALGGQV